MSDQLHISSLIIQVQPEHLRELRDWLSTCEGVEIRGTDPAGKIVAVMESHGERPILDMIAQAETRPGTLSANLVYHQIINAEEADQLEEAQS